MLDVRPFRGLYYNPAKGFHIGDVIAPPYDVISSDQRAELARRSPWNVVRLILPEGDDPYQNARRTLETWLHEEVLIQDPEPAVYCYYQTFRAPDGQEKTRKGFLSLVRLEEFEKGIILPHEATLSSPKEDRLKLLRACKANFSPIFGLYSDPEQRIESLVEKLTEAPPRFQSEEEGVKNSLWRIAEPSIIEQLQKSLADRWVLIADGHHRYESCLMYRNEAREANSDPEAPFEFTMMYLTNIDHPGIQVLPYNRGIANLPHFDVAAVLKSAGRFFEVREFEDREAAESALEKEGKQRNSFVALFAGLKAIYLLTLKPRVKLEDFYPPGTPVSVQKLDISVLHGMFIQELLGITEADVREQKYIKYYKDVKEEMKDFEAGRLQIAFFLNPTRVEQVVAVSKAGVKMPQKSTFFYPKLMTGLVINKH